MNTRTHEGNVNTRTDMLRSSRRLKPPSTGSGGTHTHAHAHSQTLKHTHTHTHTNTHTHTHTAASLSGRRKVADPSCSYKTHVMHILYAICFALPTQSPVRSRCCMCRPEPTISRSGSTHRDTHTDRQTHTHTQHTHTRTHTLVGAAGGCVRHGALELPLSPGRCVYPCVRVYMCL